MTLRREANSATVNPWAAGWRAHLAVAVWVVLAAVPIALLVGLANSEWPAWVLLIPVLLVAFWINQRLHRRRNVA